METPAPSRSAAPAVVAVVVTRNPGPWFDACVEALAEQDYPNLAVLFLDAASDDDPTPRVARVLPGAYVRRLEENRGFGWAANHVTTIVDGASFYCFLHDDAAPEPEAIGRMVGEALRSNAGIVGSKLVEFSDHTRLLQVGETVDKTGERLPMVEPGEIDQEQHDAVRDVFLAPSGCVLVRADLFGAIGGFDEGIDTLNDDLNLCWRAHVAGARVMVAPDAVVGHVEALGERSDGASRRQRLIRHRLRTMLSCYSTGHLARVLPQAALVALVEVLYSLAAGRRGHAGDVVGAWRWNWQRRAEIREWRDRISGFRGVEDNEIRPLQSRGSARLTRFVRGQTTRGGVRADRANAAWNDLRDAAQSGVLRWPIIAWAVVVALLVFGTRHLLFGPIPAVGGFLDFDLGPRGLLDAWLSGWHRPGLGSASPNPTAFGLLAGLGTVFLGAMGTLRRLLMLGPVILGLVGITRLVRPTGSIRARAIALVVYAATPVAYDAVAHARWGSIVVYGATPWILAHLARAAGWEPFGSNDSGSDAGEGAVLRPASRVSRTASFGLLVALVAAVEPAIWPLLAVVTVGLAAGSLLAGSGRGSTRVVSSGALAIAVSMLLHAPWTLDLVLGDGGWDAIVGVRGDEPAFRFADLVRFDVGPVGGGSLAWGLPLGAALALLIGRDWRFAWAVRAWTVAVGLIGLTWASGRGWLPFDLPHTETMLAPAAACFAVAAALGVVAFESDLRAYGFGWRQFAAGGAGIALLAGSLPTALAAFDGHWHLARGGLRTTFGFLDAEEPGYRLLWIGDPDVLPMAGYRLEVTGVDHTVYATSSDGLPGVADGWPGAARGSTPLIEDALRFAVDGQTYRLGRMLAPMAIRYIVLPDAMAPRPLGGVERDRPAPVLDALADQLDLRLVAVNPAYVVYRNEAALTARANVPSFTGGTGPLDVPADVVSGSTPVLEQSDGPTTASGPVAAGARVLLSATADPGWELLIDGRAAPRTTLFGWAQGFDAATGGTGVVRYDTSPLHYAVLGFEVLFWLLAITFARRGRRRVGPPAAVAALSDEPLSGGPAPIGPVGAPSIADDAPGPPAGSDVAEGPAAGAVEHGSPPTAWASEHGVDVDGGEAAALVWTTDVDEEASPESTGATDDEEHWDWSGPDEDDPDWPFALPDEPEDLA